MNTDPQPCLGIPVTKSKSKYQIFFSAVHFFHFLAIKTLDKKWPRWQFQNTFTVNDNRYLLCVINDHLIYIWCLFRTPSNRSANDSRENVLKVSKLYFFLGFLLTLRYRTLWKAPFISVLRIGFDISLNFIWKTKVKEI